MKAPKFFALLIGGALTVAAAQTASRVLTVNLDFPDESRQVMLRNIADIFDLKLELPNDYADARVSVVARHITWEEVYALCLHGSGYTYIKTGLDSVRIVHAVDDARAFDILRAKLEAEIRENNQWRTMVAHLIETGAIKCGAPDKKALAQYIGFADHSPAECQQEIMMYSPNQPPQAPASGTPAAASTAEAMEARGAPVAPQPGAAGR